jgi:Phycobilisome protein
LEESLDMNAANALAVASIRNHPKLKDLFKASEARHLTDEELWLYSSVVPYYEERARAAREIAAVEREVVGATVEQILSLYPFAKRFDGVQDRCVRDVTYVSIYATHTMLMNDPDWFRDKLLLWLKTIIQSFDFPAPDAQAPNAGVANPYPHITAEALQLPPGRSAIYDTYARLRRKYGESLTPETFHLIKGALQQACDVLAGA